MSNFMGAAAGAIFLLLLSTAVDAVGAQDESRYLFNGEHSARLTADAETGDLKTTHASIHIGERSKVGDVKTIDGEVVLAKGARANSVRSLDGAVHLEEGAKIVHRIATASGAIVLDNHVDVAGPLSTADGEIRLQNAHVGGGIVTRRGSILVGGGSRVENGIRVKRSFCLCIDAGFSSPRVVIGPGAVVQGTLLFERKVTLYVSDTATIGDVVGATPIRFSGASPE